MSSCDDVSSSPKSKLINRIHSTASILLLSTFSFNPINEVFAKEKPTLEQYFRVVEREATEKPSITRLTQDVEEGKWDDVKKFTREFGEGFKSAVLKEISKQLPEEKKEIAKKLSDTFQQDVIQVNKASRIQNRDDALKALQLVEKDLKEFLLLKGNENPQ